MRQAALTAGQHHPAAQVPTGPPADVQAAMAGVSSDIQAVVRPCLLLVLPSMVQRLPF